MEEILSIILKVSLSLAFISFAALAIRRFFRDYKDKVIHQSKLNDRVFNLEGEISILKHKLKIK